MEPSERIHLLPSENGNQPDGTLGNGNDGRNQTRTSIGSAYS